MNNSSETEVSNESVGDHLKSEDTLKSNDNNEDEYIIVKTWKKKYIDPIVSFILFILGLFALIGLVFLIMIAFFGFNAYSFSTGSMEPTIPIGSVALTKEIDDPSTIEVGDILTVHHPDESIPITHRVIRINDEEAIAEAIEKGTVYGVAEGEESVLYSLTRGKIGESSLSLEPHNVNAESIDNNEVFIINMKGDGNSSEDRRIYPISDSNAEQYIFHVKGAAIVLAYLGAYFYYILIGFALIIFYLMYPFDDYKKVKKNKTKSS